MIVDCVANLYIVVTLSIACIYLIIYNKVATYSNKAKNKQDCRGISVIIAVKNELENLKQNIPLLLAQDFPNYEIIFVDDHSSDDSFIFLEEYSEAFDQISLYSLKNSNLKGKKDALTFGIEKAQYEYLVFTDADCNPVSKQWLNDVFNSYSDKIQIVLGYGPIKKLPGIINILARVDTFYIALQYFSFALLGFPYMGVGRNLSYKKTFFLSSEGFLRHSDLLSGDDDLFIQKNANRENIAICIEQTSFMYSSAKKSLKQLFFQKRRHTSTGLRYQKTPLTFLGIIQFLNISFYFVLFSLIISGNFTWLLFLFTLIKCFSQWVVLKKSCQKFGEEDLLLFSLIFELPVICLNVLAGFTNLFIKNNKWN